MGIELVRGTAADALLADESFRAQWTSLCDRCPWSTAFQTPGFVLTWYTVYRQQFEPVLILSRSADNALDGILAMAVSTATGEVVAAGRHQSEYPTWVCLPERADDFPWEAFTAIHKAFSRATLRFHYLPGDVPLGFLERHPQAKRHCFFVTERRPLLRFGDGQEIRTSLAKGGNKSKLKRLEKLGGMTFRRVTDPAEFEAMFDDVVRLYDFRHGAVHGSGGFYTTDLQREFHFAMARVPNLLHITAMHVGGKLAAAHFGAISRDEVQLGIIVHDPALSKHSPGKLLILLLCRMLMEEGFPQFDLTPSGDAYKERFANDGDIVHTLTVHPTPLARTKVAVRGRVKLATKQFTKRVLTKLNVNPLRAKLYVRSLLRPAALPKRAARAASAWLTSQRETRLYMRPVDSPPAATNNDGVVRDSLDALLAYHAPAAGPTRQVFLSDALSRLESGQHGYTLTGADGHLAHVAWLAEPGTYEEQFAPGVTIPPDAALIATRTDAFPRGDAAALARCFRAALADAAASPKAQRIVIAIADDDAITRAVAEEHGFRAAGSLQTQIRLGRRRQSVESLDPAFTPPPPAPAQAPARPKANAAVASED